MIREKIKEIVKKKTGVVEYYQDLVADSILLEVERYFKKHKPKRAKDIEIDSIVGYDNGIDDYEFNLLEGLKDEKRKEEHG